MAIIQRTALPGTGSSEPVDAESWQAQKSANMRRTILKAALEAVVELGYARVTTQVIVDRAGVSRGAMLHHFPKKQDLIAALIDYIAAEAIEAFRREISRLDLPDRVDRWKGLDVYWAQLNSDTFKALQDIAAAARTDAALDAIVRPAIKRYYRAWNRASTEVFPEWRDKGEHFALAMDLTQSMMEGMALNRDLRDAPARVERLFAFLRGQLAQLMETPAPAPAARDTKN